jgi:hypothetical protein
MGYKEGSQVAIRTLWTKLAILSKNRGNFNFFSPYCPISSHLRRTFQIVARETFQKMSLLRRHQMCIALATVWTLGCPPPNGHPLFDKVNIDLVNSHRNCDVLSIALATVWTLGFPPPPPPPNGHPLFDKVNIDLVNCRRNCDVIKSINMLHFTDVATSFL